MMERMFRLVSYATQTENYSKGKPNGSYKLCDNKNSEPFFAVVNFGNFSQQFSKALTFNYSMLQED